MSRDFFKDPLIEDMKYTSAMKQRTIYLSEDVGDSICFKIGYFLDRIVRLDKKNGTKNPVTLIISSFGGSVYEILSIISRMEKMQEDGYVIKTVVDAKAMSCGSLLSQAGSKGFRSANRYATFLYHQVSSGTHGTLADMENDIEETKRLWGILKDITIKNTNITDEWMENIRYVNRDFYLSAEEALKLGVIDYII